MSAAPDHLTGMLARLGLKAMRDRLDNLLDEVSRRDLSVRDALDLLCEAEVRHREERRIQMGLGIAKFPFVRTLDGFDFDAQPLPRSQAGPRPSTCRWVANGDALLLLGPPGVSKSHLAFALGREAVRLGYTVLFVPATALLTVPTTLAKAHAEGRLDEKFAFYAKPKLLIVDEPAICPLTRTPRICSSSSSRAATSAAACSSPATAPWANGARFSAIQWPPPPSSTGSSTTATSSPSAATAIGCARSAAPA